MTHATPLPVPVAAAIRTDDGVIHTLPPPHRHHHILHAMHRTRERETGAGSAVAGMQGFLMSDGTFLNRISAGQCAIRAGRIERLQHPPELYSEDLW